MIKVKHMFKSLAEFNPTSSPIGEQDLAHKEEALRLNYKVGHVWTVVEYLTLVH